ncbi:MAG: hypothetical protein CVV07_01205 [Gammaproteobacteria bacterium HGW-Gammaproteobacteria-11]|nr:MAG: hypothetical protein CVV07_01205 [Gammaproteobacteria bacterium HGW-Gammaproteobacteria-11]
MGQTINMEQPFERESKVFTDHAKACLALANCVDRELRRYNCSVIFAAIDGDRPFLVVECDQPLHLQRVGWFHATLKPTPGHFIKCRTLLLGCDIEWQIRPSKAPVLLAKRAH